MPRAPASPPESATRPPPGAEIARRWRRIVPSLRDAELRIRFLRGELEQTRLATAACALEEIAHGAEQGVPLAHEVLVAIAPTLVDPQWSTRLDALRAEAHRGGHLALSRLLRTRSVAVPGPADASDPPLAVTPTGRPLTLGERKAYARRPDRFMLDRLLRDPDPDVIARVLANPRITEDDIVRLAARRPNYPAVLEQVARHPKWSTHPRVRLALALNPHTPSTVSVPLLTLLLRHELWSVVAATVTPAVVRAAAVELLERRPPIPRAAEDEEPVQ